MKGKMKKLVAFALATIMVLAMGITAFAGEEVDPNPPTTETPAEPTPNPSVPSGVEVTPESGDYTLTITNPADNHKYEVYQIYTGDVAVINGVGVLSNIKKGDYFGADKGTLLNTQELAALKTAAAQGGATLAQTYADADKKCNPITTLSTTLTSANLVGGYYLVKDIWAGGDQPEEEKFSDFIISIVGATSFAPKTLNVPTFKKTADGQTPLEIVSDKNVGDTIPFTLEATLPSNLSSYTKYKVIFKDKLSEGLEYVQNSAKLYVDGVEKTDIVVNDFVNRDFTYQIDDVFASLFNNNKVAAAGKTIAIKYSAQIKDAAITRTGEWNEATLEYSNNPNDDGVGTSKTDRVDVLNAKLVINKVKEDGTSPLEGAGFALYKFNPEEDHVYTGDEMLQEHKSTEAQPLTEFNFGGLAAGDYWLVESQTPAGYNTMDPIKITIEIVSEKDSNDEGYIKTLTVTSSNNLTWTVNSEEKKTQASANIVNVSGVQLPSTGGIGTTIFYVVGGILVVAAGILLITKKRMGGRD